MSTDADLVRALRHENFYAFTRLVYNLLHPEASFKHVEFLKAMCFALEQVARGVRTRQIITVPPRHLKSITAAVALPAFMLGRDPSKKIIVASYGNDLAARHARDFRIVTQSPVFRHLFPRFQIDPHRDTAFEIETSLRGSYKAVDRRCRHRLWRQRHHH